MSLRITILKPQKNRLNAERENEKHADGSISRILQYSNHDIELTFDSEDDYRLTNITFESERTELNGQKLIGLSENQCLRKLDLLVISDLLLDSDFLDLDSEDYFSDSKGLSFWFNEGVLLSISLFPDYETDNETIKWT